MPKVMLAEDDATMLSLLRTLLQMEGFATATLGVEEDVLESLRRETPDIVLLDVHLTQGNGLDFMQRIRQDEDLKNTFVIMSSGMALETESIQAGANAFLLKPYMPDTLIKAIKNGLPKTE